MRKKKYLFNWVAENERIEKNTDESGRRRYSSFAFSVPYPNDDCSPQHMLEWDAKKKEEEKKKKDEKETWRHRPETERFQMRRKRERSRTRAKELRTDGTPTMTALTTENCYTRSEKLRVRPFAICRPTSMCDTVRYDTRRR